MSIYEDFIQQIKKESVPPEGAFTVKMFADDVGVGIDRARSLIREQVEKGSVKDVGRFTHPNKSGHPCGWFAVVTD